MIHRLRSIIRHEHEIADRAGEGDVEPEGKGFSSQSAMAWEVVGPGRDEGEEDEGEADGGGNDVGDEEEKVKPA